MFNLTGKTALVTGAADTARGAVAEGLERGFGAVPGAQLARTSDPRVKPEDDGRRG